MKEWLKADSPADVGAFYNDQYTKNGREALSKGDWSEIISTLIEFGGPFNRGKSLLEAGCGHGEFLSNVCDDLEYTGIDVSQVACELSRERLGQDAVILNMSMEALGSGVIQNKFDYVVSFGALEHTMDPKACFNNLLNLVKPGGILFILVPLDFEDCLRYIRSEKIQNTNERFASAVEWLEYFDSKQEAWFITGNSEMKDINIIFRKEK